MIDCSSRGGRAAWLALLVAVIFCAGAPAGFADADPYVSLLDTARELAGTGNLKAARQTAEAAITVAPGRVDAYQLAGTLAHQAGDDAAARTRWTKALELAPAASQGEILKLLATLPSARTPAALGADDQRTLDGLQLIAAEADAAADYEKRLKLFIEFLSRSAAFARSHPEQIALWTARGQAAVELHQAGAAREAAQRLLPIANPDVKLRSLLAVLERNGWTRPLTIRTQLPAGPGAPANLAGKTVRPGATDLKLLWVAPGKFRMGTTVVDTQGTSMVITRGYWLGRTEVTQGQWEDVMGTNPSNFQQLGNPANRMAWSVESTDQPVEQVSWKDAMEFCRRLTAMERTAGRLPAGYEYRLPTEVEWERACRAETTGDYYGELDRIAWYDRNSADTTHEVAKKKANAWGFYDMSGNVAEWCFDWYADLSGGEMTDRAILDPDPDIPSGTTRIIRGGAWIHVAPRCQSAYRLFDDPGTTLSYVGFRVALAPAIPL